MSELIDVRGLLCPLPVIRVQDRIKNLSKGTRVKVVATDPGVLEDIPAWCRVHGHSVLESQAEQYEYHFTIEVGPVNPTTTD